MLSKIGRVARFASFAILFVVIPPVCARAQQASAPVALTAQQDHARTLKLLGLTEDQMRPAPATNPSAPRAAATQSGQTRFAFGGSATRVARAEGVDHASLNDSMANARSLADWNLCSTFFSRHRPRIRRSSGGALPSRFAQFLRLFP